MNHLPDTQREVVYMRYYQNLSFKEIADQIGVSINTALGTYALCCFEYAKDGQGLWYKFVDFLSGNQVIIAPHI